MSKHISYFNKKPPINENGANFKAQIIRGSKLELICISPQDKTIAFSYNAILPKYDFIRVYKYTTARAQTLMSMSPNHIDRVPDFISGYVTLYLYFDNKDKTL